MNKYEYIGNYKYIPMPIGQGSFSQVYKGEHKKTGEIVAIKKINITFTKNLTRDHIEREINIMKTLNHPHIVKLYENIYDTYNNVYLIMEYCPNGDLSTFLNKKPLKEKYVKRYMVQIASATKYLYDNKILHRDIKPQNIMMVDNDIIKLTDFGFAKIFNSDNDNMAQTICGSPIYMAPEIIKCNKYSIKTDLWSIGVILYEMIIGKPPYKAISHIQLIQMIDTQPIYIPMAILISKDCRKLIHDLLQKNPDNRISWDDFFNHNWLQMNDNFSHDHFNLSELIVDYDYKSNQKRIYPELRIPYNLPQSQPIDIKKSQSSSSLDSDDDDSYISPMFNKSLTFTPSDKTGYAIIQPKIENIENIEDKESERTITSSLINYMSDKVNYLKTYYMG